MATLEDTLTAKRTPLYHLLQASQNRPDGWTHLGGYVIDAGQDEANEMTRAQLARCALTDLSALARVGLRGKNAAAVLNGYHYRLPTTPNQALHQEDGSLVARLSASEYLLLGSLADDGARITRDEAAWQAESQGSYTLPRQDTHAWLALTGQHASDVMAKLCGVDLSPATFPAGKVAQTSVARINAIVINDGHANLPCLHLLVDSASACYFWPALLDAMQEFRGRAVSIMALRNHL